MRAASLLVGTLLSCSMLAAAASAQQSSAGGTPLQLGIADYSDYAYQDTASITQRMQLYQAMGITNVRAVVGWADANVASGQWNTPTQLPYMQAAVAAGMRLKLDLETIANPPDWFFAANPSAHLTDPNGQVGTHAVSYWYPNLKTVISQATDTLLHTLASNGILAHTDYVLASLGTADEPLYPAQWTLPANAVAPGFWYFDAYAQADFAVQMQALYHTIANANAAWGTSYASWAGVVPPQPATATGRLWSDTLTWYRETKRKFATWQIQNTQQLLQKYAPAGHLPVLEVIIPGDHVSTVEWNTDAASGATASADPNAVVMTDTEFLIDLAAKTGSAVHFTGMPDAPELEYIQQYITSHHYTVAVTGENVGDQQWAAMPQILATEAFGLNLKGFDLINSYYLFGNDGLTPNALYASTKVADLQLVQNWQAGKVSSLTLPFNFSLIPNGCISVDQTQNARLCLSAQGALQFLQGSTVLWSANAPLQTCTTNDSWLNECHLTFQGDGNLVLYNGATPYWNTATGNGKGATQMVVSATAPYLTIANSAGTVLWRPATP